VGAVLLEALCQPVVVVFFHLSHSLVAFRHK
jgi:hypothetical protein